MNGAWSKTTVSSAPSASWSSISGSLSRTASEMATVLPSSVLVTDTPRLGWESVRVTEPRSASAGSTVATSPSRTGCGDCAAPACPVAPAAPAASEGGPWAEPPAGPPGAPPPGLAPAPPLAGIGRLLISSTEPNAPPTSTDSVRPPPLTSPPGTRDSLAVSALVTCRVVSPSSARSSGFMVTRTTRSRRPDTEDWRTPSIDSSSASACSCSRSASSRWSPGVVAASITTGRSSMSPDCTLGSTSSGSCACSRRCCRSRTTSSVSVPKS